MPKNSTNARNDGRGLQGLVDTIAAAYEERGIARLRKTDPPVRVFGPPMKRRVVFLENPWLDYAGSWTVADGRAIILEVKSTTEPKMRIIPEGKEGAGIEYHQLVNAEAWAAAGAAVAFLWEHAGELRIFTPAMVRAITDRKSLRWCDAHKIEQGPGLIVFDFLRTLHFLTRRPALQNQSPATTSATQTQNNP